VRVVAVRPRHPALKLKVHRVDLAGNSRGAAGKNPLPKPALAALTDVAGRLLASRSPAASPVPARPAPPTRANPFAPAPRRGRGAASLYNIGSLSTMSSGRLSGASK